MSTSKQENMCACTCMPACVCEGVCEKERLKEAFFEAFEFPGNFIDSDTLSDFKTFKNSTSAASCEHYSLEPLHLVPSIN